METHVTLRGTSSVHARLNPALSNAFVYSLAANVPVYMAQLPELLFRLHLGCKFTAEQLRGVVESVLGRARETGARNFTEAFLAKYPDIGYLQHNVYLGAFLREIAYLHPQRILGVVSTHFMDMILKELNMARQEKLPTLASFLGLPEREENDTNEDLVEKHAILDAIYDTKVWRERYVENMFMYLDLDKKLIKEEDVRLYKRLFMSHYKHYSGLVQSLANPVSADHPSPK